MLGEAQVRAMSAVVREAKCLIADGRASIAQSAALFEKVWALLLLPPLPHLSLSRARSDCSNVWLAVAGLRHHSGHSSDANELSVL